MASTPTDKRLQTGTQNNERKKELSQSLRDNLKRRKSVPKKRPSAKRETSA